MPLPRLRLPGRPLAIVLCLAAGSVAGGCGASHTSLRATEAESEGTYQVVGPLTYQVQVSRVLNPADVEDRGYLNGLPPGTRPLRPDETWFGVFLRVDNERKRAWPTARDFQIVDTQGNTYRPVPLAPSNPFAYQPTILPPQEVLPDQSSLAGYGPTAGKLVLFRLRIDSLYNRPVELRIRSLLPPQRVGRVDLDI